MKKVIAALIFLFGEGLIIAAMLLLPLGLIQEVLILDILVLTILWTLMSYDILLPLWKEQRDDSEPEVGHLGVRWQGQLIYGILAILVGVLGAVYAWPFMYQVLAQAFCFCILLLFILFTYYTRGAIRATAAREQKLLDGREQMKKAMKGVQDALFECREVPDSIRESINQIESQLRFITPSSQSEAQGYEEQFVRTANDLAIALPHARTDAAEIEQLISRLQRTLAQRKQVMN